MAKDPAFLCYTGDVLKDTAFMNDAQMGIYLKAMLMQHIHTCIPSENLVLLFANASDRDMQIITRTFTVDEDGSFFIAWLRNSMNAREKFAKSRSENGAKGGRGKSKLKQEESTSFSLEKLSEIAIENVIVKENEDKGVQGDLADSCQLPVVSDELPRPAHWPSEQACKVWFVSAKSTEAEALKFFFHYEAQHWCTSGIHSPPIRKWEAAAAKWLLNKAAFGDKQKEERVDIDSNKYKNQDHGNRKHSQGTHA